MGGVPNTPNIPTCAASASFDSALPAPAHAFGLRLNKRRAHQW